MTNPNPMNSRCGLKDCDCEYTIGGLLRRLELIATEALATVKETRVRMTPGGKPFVRTLYHPLICPRGNTQAVECDDTCPCYVAGSEAERRPPGA
ncbi:hypothetical protein LCGC14_1313230 [marine sediment metagenome]|uniref:Uncharacterized protein n=1 Tax=marine sediment metagenome TaxID=412755 RepID=A0A0F9N2Q3_9ZZZZ